MNRLAFPIQEFIVRVATQQSEVSKEPDVVILFACIKKKIQNFTLQTSDIWKCNRLLDQPSNIF